VIGAFYSTRLNELIPKYVGAEQMATLPNPDALRGRPQVIQELPEPVKSDVIRAFSEAITGAIWVAVPVLLVAFVVFCMIPRIPLRTGFDDEASAPADADAAPLPAPSAEPVL
jgi:hypothetical protein